MLANYSVSVHVVLSAGICRCARDIVLVLSALNAAAVKAFNARTRYRQHRTYSPSAATFSLRVLVHSALRA
jgi:hypothetical protein